MTEDRTTKLFFELFSGLPRQGPGDKASTLRALRLVPGVGPDTRVLDIGCGTGAQALVLAEHSPAAIIAIDTHPPFVEELQREAMRLRFEDRIDARVADMRQLNFPAGSFDLIWCEGAIYNIGFETGLREWRPLLARGGHIAVTEVCWTQPDPPTECVTFWQQAYPAIGKISLLLDAIKTTGYVIVDHFAVPTSSWWDDYYRPLQQHVIEFRERYGGDQDAQELADHVQREIDIWHSFSGYYKYEFLVMRAP